MISKKKVHIDNEFIDILHFLKKWWYFKKLIIFGTVISTLLAAFILLLSIQTLKSEKYISIILRGDLGTDNSIIGNALKSNKIITNVLKTLSLELSANKFLEHLVVKKATNPLSLNLQNRISSLKEHDIKKLDLNREILQSIVKSLDNTSKDLFTVELYHVPLNLNAKQAINIVNKLVDNVNENLQKHTSDPNNKMYKIDTSIFDLDRDNSELIIIFSDILRSIEYNLTAMKSYQSLLIDVDLVKMQTLTNIAKKILLETSKLVGSTYSSEVLNLQLVTAERNIEDLKKTLIDLDKSTALSTAKYDDVNVKSVDNIALNGDMFKTILSIGGELQLNEFRIETLRKIQLFQLERSVLLTERELLKLPFEYTRTDLSLKNISERIFKLTEDVNRAIDQIYKFTQPKKAVEFIRNPELVDYNSNNDTDTKKIILILSLISFFCLSFVAFLLPMSKKLKEV